MKMPSAECWASSIVKPARWIIGSSSQVKVECSSRTCPSYSARLHWPTMPLPPVAPVAHQPVFGLLQTESKAESLAQNPCAESGL